MGSVRTQNMEKRRRRILREAHALIAAGGYEALSLRALARAAGVTVPTIYNLIGNKEELAVALFSEALAEIETRLGSHRDASPLEKAEAVVTESTGVFAEDEDYYRAAFIALEVVDQTSSYRENAARLFSWGERLIVAGCSACREAGLLRGQIPVEDLGAGILRSYRSSCRAWAFGQQGIEAFRRAALLDVYISLAADAVETFRAALMKKIEALSSAPTTGAPKGKEQRR